MSRCGKRAYAGVTHDGDECADREHKSERPDDRRDAAIGARSSNRRTPRAG
jgi:hypothetical protein